MNIIRHRGDAKETKTLKGRQVQREEKLFVKEWGAFITCAPYSEHFIYENPDKTVKASAYHCTCGSPAVVVPPGPGGMFVCLLHATYGYHTTSVINKKDFGKVAGQIITPKKNKSWI